MERRAELTEPWQILGRVWWWALIGPVLVVALFVWLESSGIYHIVKARWESGAVWLLDAALIASLVAMALRRDAFAVWWAVLVTILLLREYHFRGTSVGVYIGAAVLGVVAWWRFGMLKSDLGRPMVATGLVLAVTCYLLGVTLDQNAWDFIPQVAQGTTRDTVGQLVEEVIEDTGHAVILGLAFCHIRLKRSSP